MPKLTKRLVEALAPEADQPQLLFWDTEVRGFGLRITSNGARAYVLQYRTDKGRVRRLTIGKHGSPWTCEAARDRARDLLYQVRQGEDPADLRAQARKSMTVKELCEEYLQACDQGLIMGKRRRPKKASTLYVDRGRIHRHIIPLLGVRKVFELTTPDVNRFMRDVMLGKTARTVRTRPRGKAVVEGGVGTAARAVGLLGGILSYAVSEGIIAHNPCRGVKRPADERRDQRLTPEQYRQLGEALRKAEAAGENMLAILAIRLLAYTGCRRGEIERLKWAEIDAERRCLRLRDTKEGSSIRPAGSPVFAVLNRLRPVAGCPFVLPGKTEDKCFQGLPKVWRRVVKAAGTGPITPHILRHTHASVANDLGYTEATISALQGRSTRTMTGGYIHHLDDALVAAADKVAMEIARMMGEEVRPAWMRTDRRRFTILRREPDRPERGTGLVLVPVRR